MNFSFNTVANILCEDGAATQRLGAIVVDRWGICRILVVTDAGLVACGLVEPVLDCLRQAGHHVTLFDGVVADPTQQVVIDGADVAINEKCDLVIGLGGGSSMDVAKVVSVLAKGNQQLTDIYGIGNVKGGRLPLIQVPTTAGTGSEVTSISVITTGEATKNSVIAPQLYADMAILDATVTLNLPKHITAATGVDAMVHAIEAYTSKTLKNPMSDSLALKALSLMSQNIHQACQEGEHLDARRAMLLGAMLAGQAFANAPVSGIHALAYPLGGIYHIPHGHSNALVMPHVMKFNQSVVAKLYAEIADTFLPGIEGSDDYKSSALIDALNKLPNSLDLKVKLSGMNIEYEALDMLASEAMLYQRLLVHNPREIKLDDARAIYEAAF